MGEHRRTKSEKPRSLIAPNLSKLQRTYVLIGIMVCLGNLGFPGGLLDRRSAITSDFDWISIAVIVLSLAAALLTWFADGIFARHVTLGVSALGFIVGLLDLWLLVFERHILKFDGQTKAAIFAACTIILSLISFSATRLIIARPALSRS